MKNMNKAVSIAVLGAMSVVVQASPVDELLDEYAAAGGGAFSAESGSDLWRKPYVDAKSGKERACTSCHGADLSLSGKHAKTGKVIKPMALSVNGKRLADKKKIRKWFKRNCKWTLGRECNAQEKGDFLAFIRSQ